MTPKRFLAAALGICALALVLRLGAFWALDRLARPDVWESESIAVSLLEGRGFVYRAGGIDHRSYLDPLYPGLCALIYALTGHSFLALGLVQAGLGTLLVGLVLVCSRRAARNQPGQPELQLDDRRSAHAALGAGGLAAVHPGLILYTTKFHPFILDSLFLLLLVAACLFFQPRQPWRSVAWVGAAIGLGALTRATILVTLPIALWWTWTRSEGPALRRLGLLGTLVGVTGLLLAPWVMRNHAVHGRLMLRSSGFVFWLGNNPHEFSGSALTASRPVFDSMPAAQRAQLAQLDELGQQDFLGREAMDFVRAHPIAFVQRWVRKLWYFWWHHPQAGRLYPAAWFPLYQSFYVVLMALAAAGLVAYRRHRDSWLVVGLCATIAAAQSLYYVEGRHRLAIEPVLMLLAGGGISWALARAAKVRGRRDA